MKLAKHATVRPVVEIPPVETCPPDAPAEVPPLHGANLAGVLGLALQLHQDGHLAQAEALYRRILDTTPAQVEALHLLGVLCHQTGRDREALRHLREATRADARDASIRCDLGEVYRALHRFEHAIAEFERALELEPDHLATLCNLGHAHLGRGRFADAEACYRRGLERLPDDPELWCFLGIALANQERTADAADAYRRALLADPDYEEARYLLSAAIGAPVDSAPRGYVRTLFDRFAHAFDRQLVETLHYAVPAALPRLLASLDPALRAARVLDLGCGTGLCGPALRAVASHLEGVDLSPRMLERAAQTGRYDALREAELHDAVTADGRTWDLVVAADVLVYVGRIERFLELVPPRLAPCGRLILTIEESDGEPCVLRPSGRFAHGPAHVRNVAEAQGLTLEREVSLALRNDRGRPIRGRILVFRKPSD